MSDKKIVWGTSEGLITVHEWIMVSDGEEYRRFWCKEWVIVTDKSMPVEGFRSSEHWTLFGMHEGVAQVIIPGCGVKGWVRCSSPPKSNRRSIHCIGVD